MNRVGLTRLARLAAVLLVAALARADEAGDLYAAADTAYNGGQFDKALPSFRSFVAKFAKDERAAIAAYRIGQCLGQLKQYGEAADAFDACVRGYGESKYADGALFNKGYYYFCAEKWQPAAAAYFDYTKIGKKPDLKAKAWFWRGEALYKMSRPDDAAAAYETFLASPAEILAAADCKDLIGFARLGQGVCHYAGKRWEKALAGFRRYLDENADGPSADEAMFYAAECHKQLGAADQAVALLAKLADTLPKSDFAPQGLRRIAAIEAERGNVAASKAAADRLAKDYPDLAKYAGEERFNLAYRQLQAKNYEAAEKLYRDALEGLTGEPEAIGLLGLAEARFGQSKWTDAEAAYLLVLQKHPDHPNAPTAQARLAEVYLREAKFPEAEKVGREYLAKYATGSDLAVVRYNLAFAVWKQGRAEEAMKLFDEVVGADPKADSSAPVLIEMGRFGIDSKRWADARRAYELYLKHHATKPAAMTARWGLAQVAEGEGDQAAAIAAYRAFADQAGTDPLVAEALGRLVDLYRKAGQEEKAQLAGQELRRKFPGSQQSARSLLTAGYSHFNAKRYAEAIFAFEAYLRDYAKEDGAAAALANLAASYYLSTAPADHYAKAAEAYARLAKDYPADKAAEDALYWSGQALRQAGDEPGAIAALDQFITTHAQHARVASARLALAQLLSRAKRFADAVKVLTEAVAAATEPAARGEARYELAWALLDAERKDEAYAAFAEVSKDVPGTDLAADADFRLCGQLVEKARYTDAVTAYGDWLKAHDQHKLKPRALYNLAWAQELAASFKEAVATYEQAGKLLDDPDLRAASTYRRGYCLLRAGDVPGALAAFDAYDKDNPQGRNRPDSLFYRGQAHSRAGKWSEAEAAFKQLVKEFPEHALTQNAQFNLGVALQNQSKYQAAADSYEPLCAADTKPPVDATLRARALLQRGQCLFMAARYADAVTALSGAETTGLTEVLPAARYYLGRCFQQQNDPKKAKDTYEKVLAQHPGTEWAEKSRAALAQIQLP